MFAYHMDDKGYTHPTTEEQALIWQLIGGSMISKKDYPPETWEEIYRQLKHIRKGIDIMITQLNVATKRGYK